MGCPNTLLTTYQKTNRRSDKCRSHLQGKKDILQAATYVTRRMAAQVARETGIPTNRKKIQHIYRKIDWNGTSK